MGKNITKIILVATNGQKKSLVFVDDALKVYSLQEAIKVAKNNLFENVYTVNRSGNLYLRTKPSTSAKEHIDKISISSHGLFYSLDDITYALSIPAIQNYWQKFQQTLSEAKNAYIIIDGFPRILKESVKSKLQANKNFISAAAEKFNIDIYLLAAILIDEIARLAPFEEIADMLSVQFLGRNTSVGIAQVKVDTARGLMLSDYYNPDPIKFSSKEKIKKATRREIYNYIKQSKHSIFFAAARMHYLINEWKKFVDLSEKSEIIATLYSLSKDKPKSNPQPNDRGLQIANEFYKLAENWLK